MKKVVVIGGGAAGMIAAVAAAEAGNRVCLLEKNEKLGKKIFITGKGRCNVTNAADREVLFANVMTNGKFLYSAFNGFDNLAMMDFLERAGCQLKVERGDRVFPVSDHSSDVIAALIRELKKHKVEVRLGCVVKDVLTKELNLEEPAEGGKWNKRVTGVRLADGTELPADSVITATGGISYVLTGSTGDGYRFAADTGHKLVECYPSLVPFNIEETWCRTLMGLSLKNVSVRLVSGGREIYSGFGEMLFTHFGISGPLILSASSYYVKNVLSKASGKRAEKKESGKTELACALYIDLKPALSEEQLDKRILRDFDENKNKQFRNALNGLFPAKLIPVMIALSGISPDKKVNEITREERMAFGTLIKNLPLTVAGVRDYNEAIITKGGVSVKDVNPSTMESKKVKGMYFAGEVLDLDALTGGFNLQIAWSTGYLAGKSC